MGKQDLPAVGVLGSNIGHCELLLGVQALYAIPRTNHSGSSLEPLNWLAECQLEKTCDQIFVTHVSVPKYNYPPSCMSNFMVCISL